MCHFATTPDYYYYIIKEGKKDHFQRVPFNKQMLLNLAERRLARLHSLFWLCCARMNFTLVELVPTRKTHVEGHAGP